MLHATFGNSGKLRFYWSKQHGAYLTLISSWLIAGILNGFDIQHIILIFFLLSGLNSVELFSEKLNRKSPLQFYKNIWLKLYAGITITLGILLLCISPSFRILSPTLLATGSIYVWLTKGRMQKKIISEWIIFSIISYSAFITSSIFSIKVILPSIITMSLFFGLSVFTVKERLHKIHFSLTIIYALFATTIIYLLFQTSIFTLTITLLILFRLAPNWVSPTNYNKLNIRTIGIIESLFQLFFILAFYFFY